MHVHIHRKSLIDFFLREKLELWAPRRCYAVGKSVGLASGMLGVRIPAATDLSREKRYLVVTAPLRNARGKVLGS